MLRCGERLFYVLGLLFFSFLIGCGDHSDSKHGFRYLIPWQTSDGHFQWDEISLYSLNSPHILDGGVARIYSTLQFTDQSSVDGYVIHPKIMKTSSGTYVPEDKKSLSAITIYAHFEALRKMDLKLGLSELRWPRQVAFEIPIRDQSGRDVINNASYIEDYDLITVAPFLRQDLPLAINGAVLAHEHFHAHFYHIVKKVFSEQLNKDLQLNDEIKNHNYDVIRSWNEGLADLWGYFYSKNFDPMRLSFSDYNGGVYEKTRSLEVEFKPFRDLLEMRNSWNKKESTPYNEGTNLARFLLKQMNKSFYKDSGAQKYSLDEEKFANWLLDKLKSFPSVLVKKFEVGLLVPADLIDHLFYKDEPALKEVCPDLEKLLSINENYFFYKRLCRK